MRHSVIGDSRRGTAFSLSQKHTSAFRFGALPVPTQGRAETTDHRSLTTDDYGYTPHVRRASLLVLFLTVFIDLIGFGMVIPFLSFYAREYGASGVMVGAVVVIYSIMQFFFAPVWGRLSDRLGRRPVILISLTASCTGYFLFGIAHSLAILFVSRLIPGAGGAPIGTATPYTADSPPPALPATGITLIGAAFGMGFILG